MKVLKYIIVVVVSLIVGGIISLIIFCSLLQAKEYKDTITDFEVVKVRDGDTFVITISNIPDVFGDNIAVRIRGIDTPEKNDDRENIKKIALEAKA